jgi:hypothetical protein
MSHIIERAQAVWLLSKEVDRFEYVGCMRDSMRFNRFAYKLPRGNHLYAIVP